ncbi:mitochondrial carrier [Tilletiaria anomala UBC 951]|uniref:Mitochondrial carrier n=1 Tax=Tilletiaria anomala (strain ATCC 24038 / CBS 436.72 / UBC 951) TaxID=1037660 RepID=A0A066W1X5_TILAU|nr:mitochondrial carrier [Tilletiaria anomala UBC 951]KDN47952.1 mitochondrial carrier [Tilletiaria anomala UBC 951]
MESRNDLSSDSLLDPRHHLASGDPPPPKATITESLIKDKTSWSYVVRSGLAGGIAGCVAKTAVAPLDRVKILFQAQNPEFAKYSGKMSGVFRAANEIARSQGVMALFQGHSATLLRIFPYAAIKYMAYDKLHFHLMPTKNDETGARLFLAGSASGVLSVFVTYPLELIRVRLAFETKRKRESGGLSRIIRQIYTEGSTEAPFSGDARKRAGRAAASVTPGAGAGATAGLVGSTAHLSTSALQRQAVTAGAGPNSPVPMPRTPTVAEMKSYELLTRFPMLKFYRGFSVTVMGMIPYAGTSFLVFGRCKTTLQTLFPPREDSVAHGGRRAWWWPSKTTVDLTAGALAGAISQTAAYPFEVIRRRQQVGATIRPGSLLGMRETAMWIWRTSGFKGFYVGLSIGFLKVVPMTSISFAVWMGMKRQMGI